MGSPSFRFLYPTTSAMSPYIDFAVYLGVRDRELLPNWAPLGRSMVTTTSVSDTSWRPSWSRNLVLREGRAFSVGRREGRGGGEGLPWGGWGGGGAEAGGAEADPFPECWWMRPMPRDQCIEEDWWASSGLA